MKPLLVSLSLAAALSMTVTPTDAGRGGRPSAFAGNQASPPLNSCDAAARARARGMPPRVIAVLENMCRNTRRQNPAYAVAQMSPR